MVKIKEENKVATYIEKIFVILLTLFGIFIAYQIIKLLFFGSWSAEDIVISLLVFNLGAVFTIGLMLATLVSDHKHLTSDHRHLVDSFNHLAKDFKEHLKRHK